MARQRLYVVHGMGNDAVGLVGRITTPIARAGGNILDLRQDVLHGLFTIYMVVDLTASQLDFQAFQTMVEQAGEETGLAITVDRFSPVPRSPDKKNLLMICIGRDKPGIIAASSDMLGKYNANIEFAQTIGREGVFLMELLTDVSHASIPVENLKRTVAEHMEALRIKTVFQDEQVFIKRKRIILFQIASSFIDGPTFDEIARQTGLTAAAMRALFSGGELIASLRRVAAKLDGLPLDVIHTLLGGVAPTPGSMELIQTLKVMGYKIALASTGLTFFTDYVRTRLGIDYAFGVPLQVDDDARVLVGELETDATGSHDFPALLSELTAREGIQAEDVTVITDEGCAETPGIRLQFDLEVLLDCFNRHAISGDNLAGVLGSFGAPRLS